MGAKDIGIKLLLSGNPLAKGAMKTTKKTDAGRLTMKEETFIIASPLSLGKRERKVLLAPPLPHLFVARSAPLSGSHWRRVLFVSFSVKRCSSSFPYRWFFCAKCMSVPYLRLLRCSPSPGFFAFFLVLITLFAYCLVRLFPSAVFFAPSALFEFFSLFAPSACL